MFFGRGNGGVDNDHDDSHYASRDYQEYKDQAVIIAQKVGENAKYYKDKALDWLSQFSTPS